MPAGEGFVGVAPVLMVILTFGNLHPTRRKIEHDVGSLWRKGKVSINC